MNLVVADASTKHVGLHVSHDKHAAAQIAFGLFFPGTVLRLAALLHSIHECGERKILFQHLTTLRLPAKQTHRYKECVSKPCKSGTKRHKPMTHMLTVLL